MARTSGSIGAGAFRESFAHAEFTDPSTGASYRISPADSSHSLSFERPGTEVRGSRTIGWYLGSGRIGRSYLFATDGFLYQSPVSYFSKEQRWGASPGFERRTTVDLTRPVEPACLQCHATRPQPVAGTQNRYARIPFLQSGIGCERCHGAGEAHIALMRSARKTTAKNLSIVNPAKLSGERRDSVCAQCHLTGAARVARPKHASTPYRPGALLSDSIAIFVWSDARNGGVAVTSHFEKLNYSQCREESGRTLWCGTCHDAHGAPKTASQHRQKCVQCHTSKTCGLDLSARRAANDECQTCHMPKSPATDLQHAVYTDHSIPRRPAAAGTSTEPRRLMAFWPPVADNRDSALAHAVVAMTEPAIRRQALTLLEDAAARDAADLAIAAQLAQFYDRMGQPARALPLLELVTAKDVSNTSAAINLGSLYAQAGRVPEAMQLWEEVLKKNPALTGARLNLAVAQLRSGAREAGIANLRLALLHDPDNPQARTLLREAGTAP